MDEALGVDLEAVRQRLVDRRGELRRLVEEGHEATRPVELDQAQVGRLTRMDALQSQAMAQETERRRIQELQRIDAALARIEAGEFGYCLECSEPIAPKRLELDPTVTLCIDCARG